MCFEGAIRLKKMKKNLKEIMLKDMVISTMFTLEIPLNFIDRNDVIMNNLWEFVEMVNYN